MKKLIALFGLGLSLASYGQMDSFDREFQDFSIGRAWGYTGFEIGSNFLNVHNGKRNLFQERYLNIKGELERTSYFLDRDNTDRDKLINVEVSKLHSDSFTTNNVDLILGLSREAEGRIGIKGTFGKGELKKNDKKVEKIGGQLFYNFDDGVTRLTTIGFINRNTIDNSKIKYLDYGANVRWQKNFEYMYFEYIDPSYFVDGSFTILENKSKKIKEEGRKTRNVSTDLSVGLEAKNVVEIDDTKITTKGYVAYEHEFFKGKKYKSLNIREKDIDKGVVGLKMDVNVSEVLDVYADVQLKKSFNSSKTQAISSVGFKISF